MEKHSEEDSHIFRKFHHVVAIGECMYNTRVRRVMRNEIGVISRDQISKNLINIMKVI